MLVNMSRARKRSQDVQLLSGLARGGGGGVAKRGGLGAPGLWEIGFSLREIEFGFHFDGRAFISAA